MILDDIIEKKKDYLQQLGTPAETKNALISEKTLDFLAAIKKPGLQVIAEVKQKSPSTGTLCAPYLPEHIARKYKTGGTAAISVLTDEPFFGGKMDDMLLVKDTTNLPVLCKDFIIDERQVVLARHYGADAVLLIMRILTLEQAQALKAKIESLNMLALIEIFNDTDLEKALKISPKVLMINHRNLDTLKIDCAGSGAHSLINKIPLDIPIIAASGILEPEQTLALHPRVEAVLIGTGLLKLEEPELFIQKIININKQRRRSTSKIKICGITNLEDALLAESLGADFLGFIFEKSSPRYINYNNAKNIITQLKTAKPIGVFVSQEDVEIEQVATDLNLWGVQIYCKDPHVCSPLFERGARGDFPSNTSNPLNCNIIRVIHIKNADDFHLIHEITKKHPNDYFLLDTHHPEKKGGTGETFDWTLLPENLVKCFLSGGINPDNIEQALSYQPFCVDLCSGVEHEQIKGKKEEGKLKKLFECYGEKSPLAPLLKRGEQTCETLQEQPHGTLSYFGTYGGAYVPETLIAPLKEIEEAFLKCQKDTDFQNELKDLLLNFAGRPTALTHAKRLSEILKRTIYLKREDLLHGGAHKTNNTIGQGLLAKYMGKKRLIAETGAGQHGVATSMIGALLGIPVTVYMGAIDVERQALNVERMKLFGATVVPVESGSKTLKDAINDALRDWLHDSVNTFYVFGTAAGPHPFPQMVRYFQEVIGKEARSQLLEKTGKLPDAIYACVGGGSNAIGLYSAFLEDADVKIFGAEAAGQGINTDYHAATLTKGTPGIFHGMHSYFLQDSDGQITETHSISAGLDYPGIGPEHVFLKETKRVTYEPITDQEALHAFEYLAQTEGILPALESSHAVALALKKVYNFPENSVHLINISGRGDKDLMTYLDYKKEQKASEIIA